MSSRLASRGKRVCILTTGSIDSNPRLVKEASALQGLDFDVTTVVNRLPGLLDLSDKSELRWQIYLIGPKGRWHWRLLRSAQIASKYLKVLTRIHRFADFGIAPQARQLLAAACNTPADMYIAHYAAALPAAAAGARRHNALYAYDAEDFHLGEWPDDPTYDTERHLVRTIESRYLPGCAYVTASSPLIADALVETYGIKPPQVVLNVFPLRQAPAAPTPRGRATPGPSLYWFSQTIGPHRGLECAIRALGLSALRPHLYLRGTPATGFADEIRKLAAEMGVEGHVHILPPTEPERMETLAADYDLGLASEVSISRNREICLSNKLFSFLLAGLPPLMSNTTAQRRFAMEAGLAHLLFPMDDASALAGLIDRILADPAQFAALREKVWRLGQERYNWDRESEIIKGLAAQVHG